jgi:drug/metabolite transporter (DMT)-like permease
MEKRDTDWSVWTALLLVQVFFGVHYVGAKVVLAHMSPAAWAVLRILAAAVILEAWVLLGRREVPRRLKDWALLAGFSLCGVVLNQILFVEGLARTTPSHSALINTTIPVWTYLFVYLLRHESLTARKVGGLGLALGGVWLLQADSLGDGGALVLGDFLTLLNSISFGLFLAVSKRYLERHDPIATTAHIFAIGSVGVVLYGGWDLARLEVAAVPAAAWWWAAWIVIFPTVGAYALNYYALRRVHSTLVALFIYLQPLIATALAAVLLRSWPGWVFYPAAALVFAGVGLAVSRGRNGRETVAA